MKRPKVELFSLLSKEDSDVSVKGLIVACA